ncbi:MAG: RsmB/NOP family class I SAM-dependent RNA methyltransferase [Spirochaetaceae bacterium]|nr:RsmB/NOP family class I SAM-dependent RNA methyltransferase [Spirochaetaceae bacterium]
MRTKRSGPEAFEDAYAALFGSRWEGLKAALLGKRDLRPWAHPGFAPYFLDSGSIACALALPLSGARAIFDCCAAPGGKSLVLASVMDSGAALHANDRSPGRARRLRDALGQCLPPDILSRVSVTGMDAGKLARNRSSGTPGPYDAILLDAPCSSERHVLSAPAHLARWSPGRGRNLAVRQWALLSAAFRLLKAGGVLVYATCALNPAENDGVVSRLLGKFPAARLFQPPPPPEGASAFFPGSLPGAEKTDLGFRILPDLCAGAGPMFFACVRKAGDDAGSDDVDAVDDAGSDGDGGGA